MNIRHALLGLCLYAVATSVSAIPTTINVDQTFDNWSNSTVYSGQTVSWVFDYSGSGITADSVVDSAILSITALGVDNNPDPVRVETSLFLGNLTPGSGTSTFDILGYNGTYQFLLDGMLEVSVTASEVSLYSESHPYQDTHTRYETHYRYTHHSCGLFGWFDCHDYHPYTEGHNFNVTHYNTHLHARADSLELSSSNLKITAQDPHTQDPHSVPEPSILLLMLTGFGVVGFKSLVAKQQK